ncbi:MAG: PspC domain-containing protein [Anaerolineae bacterium]|nr:PspC domain-containing protein [Anaerolineae bacterium]
MNNKTLYRTEKDKMIGGVCGGLGEYFEIDPALVRLLFALIFFGYGAGLMVYVLLWIIMPSEDMLEVRKNLVT